VTWFILHGVSGDASLWMAMANIYAPYLFLPLVVIILCALAVPWSYLGKAVPPPVLVFALLYGHLFLPGLPAGAAADQNVLTVMSVNI
jgi:hypothetical protein